MRKVCAIGYLRLTIPFAGKNTFAPQRFKTASQTANPRKKIDKGKSSGITTRGRAGKRLEHFQDSFAGFAFTAFKAVDLAFGVAET